MVFETVFLFSSTLKCKPQQQIWKHERKYNRQKQITNQMNKRGSTKNKSERTAVTSTIKGRYLLSEGMWASQRAQTGCLNMSWPATGPLRQLGQTLSSCDGRRGRFVYRWNNRLLSAMLFNKQTTRIKHRQINTRHDHNHWTYSKETEC